MDAGVDLLHLVEYIYKLHNCTCADLFKRVVGDLYSLAGCVELFRCFHGKFVSFRRLGEDLIWIGRVIFFLKNI